MKKRKQNFKKINHNLFVLFALILVMIGTSSCEPLRKKFVRAKKKDAQNTKFIPVLSPIDYIQATVSPTEKYKYHYGLWRVWIRDYLTLIEKNGSDKREKYLLDQVILQVTEMQKWLPKAQAEELIEPVTRLKQARAMYRKPESVRNVSMLKRRIDLAEKMIRRRFAPKIIFPETK